MTYELQYFCGEITIDNEIIIEILEKCKLSTGTNRKKKYKEFWGKYPTKGMISATWGYTKRFWLTPTKKRKESKYYGLYQTQIMTDNPHLEQVFQEYAVLHLPTDFYWTQVQINKNYRIQPHVDAPNQGFSYIVGMGDYGLGQLCINKGGKTMKVNVKDKPYRFNGSRLQHWVEDWINGDRWTLVFFTHHTKNGLKELAEKKISIKSNE
jgi:hypothetical protein